MPKLFEKDSCQNCSTEGDSSSDRQQEIYLQAKSIKTNPTKHKTELCKTYSELGYCNYGCKCKFAHGRQELISSSNTKLYKDRKCKGFWKNGVCPYGMRCQFGHAPNRWALNSYLIGLAAIVKANDLCLESRLLRLL